MQHFSFTLIFCVFIVSSGEADVNQTLKPSIQINRIFEDFFRDMIELNPELAAQLGISEKMGAPVVSDSLTDVSEEAISQEYDLLRKYELKLSSFNLDQLPFKDRLNAEVLKSYLSYVLQGEKYRSHAYLINFMTGIHNSLTTLMTSYHALENITDARNYVHRLRGYPTKFNQALKSLKLRQKKRIVSPKVIIFRTREAMSEFISSKPRKNILYLTFQHQLEKMNTGDKKLKQALLNEVEQAISESVYPAYQSYISYLEEVMQIAPEAVGVWNLPNGENYYRYCLSYHTNSISSPTEIHLLGLAEVKRIQALLGKLYQKLKIDPRADFMTMNRSYWKLLSLKNPERFYYSPTAQGKRRALRDYRLIIKRSEKKLSQLFSLKPDARVTVQRTPDYLENTIGTFYSPAPLDGSRQGIFYTNLNRLPFKPDMQTLTFHEAIPGHHFQYAIQNDSALVCMFRHLFFFTAYVEGWALYAERLAYEQGWLDDIHSQIGYVRSELFRAVRLVVDTGIHHQRWSRKQAFNYMLANLGWASYQEIDRYCVWPGQACAYKMGELKILELRALSQMELGEKFDLKEFHKALLEYGSVPLDILEQVVRHYLKNTASVENIASHVD
ncbi:DUF885 family protein [candidate division CSSED10-310 bacterium]|uniref:DUF885 family protein n=1 Tax=candidate division CSSED10-310 bacterium TaxID=2855610 RepID=A0ABV6Z6F9_UNCC1